jgi:nucleoid-associated protein YgaU
LQVFGDNPGPGPQPGTNLREVEIVIYPDLIGWLLYRVEKGDTLTGIVRKARDFGRTTVPQIVAANAQIKDPDVIQTGWQLRIPLS